MRFESKAKTREQKLNSMNAYIDKATLISSDLRLTFLVFVSFVF